MLIRTLKLRMTEVRMIETSIIIANHNGKRFLKDCFESIYKSNYPMDKLEVIMVDNNSNDKSVEFTKKNFPRVNIILNSKNDYCNANNKGIKASRAQKYIVLLNNDTVVEKNWLKELIQAAEPDKKIGCVSSKLLFLRRKTMVQSTGLKQLPGYYWIDKDFEKKSNSVPNKVKEVDAVSFAGVLIKKKCIQDVGLLDEDFQIYLEDVDFSLRCWKKGWRMVCAPKSIVYHYFRGTGSKRLAKKQCDKNRLLIITKHFPEHLAKELDSFVENQVINAVGKSRTIYNRKIAKKIQLINELYSKIRRLANAKFSLTVEVEQVKKQKQEHVNELKKQIKLVQKQKQQIQNLTIKEIIAIIF